MRKILIITPHFWPENFLINIIAKKFAELKIKTTIVTSFPNYPGGKVFKKYKNIKKPFIIEHKENIKIIRFPIYPRKNANSINLTLNYLSFIKNGYFALKKLNLKNQFDKIFVYSVSPITSAFLGIYLKNKYKKKISLWIQDLWPESVRATGHINNFLLIFLIELIVKFIYSKMDNIIVQSEYFIKEVKKYTKKKIHVIENSHFSSISKNKYKKISSKIDILLKEKFCITFSGNIGRAQSIKTVLDTAKKLENIKKIHFLIVGGGSEKENIKEYIKQKYIKNVTLYGPVDPSLALKICKKSKGLILSLADKKIFKLTIPNKFQTYLNTGVPILSAAEGIVNDIVKKNKIGFTSKNESSEKLSINVKKLYKLSKEEKQKIKLNMNLLYKKKFKLENQIRKLIKVIFNEK